MAKVKPQSKTASKGKTALKTTGRALKGAARGVLAAGSQILGAGAKALNPFSADGLPIVDRKSAAWRQMSKKHKAEIIKREKYEQAIIDTARRLHAQGKYTDAQIWTALWNRFGYQGDVKGGMLSLQIDKKTYRIPLAKNPKRKNKTIIRKAKKVIVLNKTAKKKATKRKRNLDHKDSTHQIEVSRHWRAGGLSQWQRAHHAGQHDLFAHGIKARAKHNPMIQPGRRYKMKEDYEPTAIIEAGMRGGFKAVFIAKDGLAGQVGGFKSRAEAAAWAKAQGFKVVQKTKKRNAARAIRPSRKAKGARGVSSSSRKTRSVKRVAKAGKGSAGKTRRNPSASEIRTEFAGRHARDSQLYFPDGTPQGLAKLGKLILIKTDSGPIELVNQKGQVWLCADTKKRLHLGSTINAPLFDGPAQSFGKVKVIEYEESKPHLGYHRRVIWFHHMGEKGGRRPELISNSKGELRFKGGDYTLTSRGIEN